MGKPSKKSGVPASYSSAMKFRPPTETCRSLAKGTKPLADAASVSQVLVMMIIHFCRKIMYGIDLPLKVGIYIIGTLFLSLIGDFGKESTSYFSQRDNFLNLFFVKFSWGWTLIAVLPFMLVTGFTTTCGQKHQLKPQALRVALATCVWYFMTSLFLTVEDNSGMCNVIKFTNKVECNNNGFRWKGFDISGHTFLLIFANLFILEEGKAYLGWERIKDMLRLEEHKRMSTEIDVQEVQGNSTALSKLSLEEFLHLRSNYIKFTPYVRGLFCFLAILSVLWDFMLICTILYFHIMIEKVVASCIAVMLWFLLYRVIYLAGLGSLVSPPGFEGPFKYVTYKTKVDKTPSAKDSATRGRNTDKKPTRGDDIPKFLGMPLYGLNKQAATVEADEPGQGQKSGPEINPVGSLKGSRSRSTSRIGLPRGSSKSSLNLKYL